MGQIDVGCICGQINYLKYTKQHLPYESCMACGSRLFMRAPIAVGGAMLLTQVIDQFRESGGPTWDEYAVQLGKILLTDRYGKPVDRSSPIAVPNVLGSQK